MFMLPAMFMGCLDPKPSVQGPDDVPAIVHAAAPSAAVVSLPAEAIPRDLDVVVRVDVARLRAVLSDRIDAELRARFARDALLSAALEGARALTIGLRLADFEAGDRVVAIDGPATLPVDPSLVAHPSSSERVSVHTRDSAARDTTLLVARFGERGAVLATPVEADAVLRVLRSGPDDDRGQPAADGLLTFDVRPQRLPFSLERRYPSFCRMVAQLARLRGALRVDGDRLRLEIALSASHPAGANRVARFVEALRDGAPRAGLGALLGKLEVETIGLVVQVGLEVPTEALPDLLAALDAAT